MSTLLWSISYCNSLKRGISTALCSPGVSRSSAFQKVHLCIAMSCIFSKWWWITVFERLLISMLTHWLQLCKWTWPSLHLQVEAMWLRLRVLLAGVNSNPLNCTFDRKRSLVHFLVLISYLSPRPSRYIELSTPNLISSFTTECVSNLNKPNKFSILSSIA